MKKTKTKPLNHCFFFTRCTPTKTLNRFVVCVEKKQNSKENLRNEKEREYDKVPTYSYCS
jgi:hypothetical protein